MKTNRVVVLNKVGEWISFSLLNLQCALSQMVCLQLRILQFKESDIDQTCWSLAGMHVVAFAL
jgi:hypothetical protein